MRSALAMWLGVSALTAGELCAQTVTLFTEDFDGLAGSLIPPVNECYSLRPPAEHPSLCGWLGVWTDTPPSGWSVDDTGVPGYDQGVPGNAADNDGVTEWVGWSFAKKDWWVAVAGDQNRSQFTKGVGIVAIADPDEWDDANHPQKASGWTAPGDLYYDAWMSSPTLAIPAGATAGSITMTFDSSWRPEGFDDGAGAQDNNQTAVITVSYDGGPEIEVLRWDSQQGGPYFHPDSTNETVTIPLNNPDGATNLKLKFGLLMARNDWWWALDNISVRNQGTPFYTQNFESLNNVATLRPAEEEAGPP
ncbi:MAG: hypothetical protein HRF43_17095, partial [Phycisphaerae bacterium]